MAKTFMKGNQAAAEAAIRAGCKGFFFYPVTPASEIGEYMSEHLDDRGGVFVQAESEIAAINMMMGASATGARVLTGTSGVGFSLMTECMSYMSGCQLPGVVIDVMRGGPGLGNMEPSQADYNQVSKAIGHGGHMIPVFSPSNAQEIADLVVDAFDIAEEYRTPVVLVYEGNTAQLMESVELPEPLNRETPNFSWAFTDEPGRGKRVLRSGFPHGPRTHIMSLYAKWDRMQAELQRYEEIMTDDADVIIVAFGLLARVCKTAVKKAREQGLKVGMIRPISLTPFPVNAFEKFRDADVQFLTLEMNYGLMKNDVILALGSDRNAHYAHQEYGTMMKMRDIIEEVRKVSKGGAQ